MAPAPRSRIAVGLLVGAAFLPTPTVLARDHPDPVEQQPPVSRPDDDHAGPWAGRRAGEGRLRPGRPPAGPSSRPDAPAWSDAADPSASARPSVPGSLPSTGPPGPSAKPESALIPERDELEMARPGTPSPFESQPREPAEPEWTEAREAPVAPSSSGAPDSDPSDADAPSAGEGSGAQASARPAGRTPRVLPLGTGLALMGLGLAFIGFRLRQR